MNFGSWRPFRHAMLPPRFDRQARDARSHAHWPVHIIATQHEVLLSLDGPHLAVLVAGDATPEELGRWFELIDTAST